MKLCGDQQTCGSAGDADHEALDQQLADDPLQACADGRTYGNLALSG